MTMTECSILIVDDDYLIATELSVHLRASGFEVLGPFARAEDARRALADTRPDGVFLDINLGEGRTSYALANELRKRGIPFAFISGYSAVPEDKAEFDEIRLLTKPVDPDHAIAEARYLCGGIGAS